MPTELIRMPIRAAITPLAMDRPDRAAIMVRAKMSRENSSVGPKRRARRAMGWATTHSIMIPKASPNTEA